MSSNRRNTDRQEGELDGERIVELAVDRTAEPSERENEQLMQETDLQGQLSELRGFVARQREVVAKDSDSAKFTDLSNRILSATTRRRPSLVGDLRLVRDLVLLRCRQSVWVRLAAASLILHLAALPVVAWFVLREPAEPHRIFFAPPVVVEESPRLDEKIDAVDPDVVPMLEEENGRRLDAFEVANARRLERFSLHRWGAPDTANLSSDGLVERVLAARSSGINTGGWSELEELEDVSASPLAEALFVEALLDRAVLDDAALAGDQEALRAALERLRPVPSSEPSSATPLIRAAVLRAMELGFDSAELRILWRVDSWADAGVASRREQSGKPLSNRWFTEFEHASQGLARGAVLDAWLDGIPR